jgi:hypothetical protein
LHGGLSSCTVYSSTFRIHTEAKQTFLDSGPLSCLAIKRNSLLKFVISINIVNSFTLTGKPQSCYCKQTQFIYLLISDAIKQCKYALLTFVAMFTKYILRKINLVPTFTSCFSNFFFNNTCSKLPTATSTSKNTQPEFRMKFKFPPSLSHSHYMTRPSHHSQFYNFTILGKITDY